jgi:DNA-binding PadR family transcriptional regulator
MKNNIFFKSSTKKKILLLLLGGLALGLATSPRSQKRTFNALCRDWKNIDKQNLYRHIKDFEKHKMIRYVNKGQWWSIELTERGKCEAKKIKLSEIKINKPKKWDKRWHLVIFDVPEKNKIARDALRKKIKEIGLVEIQKSTFIHPYPCKKEIDKVINFFGVENFVLQLEILTVDKLVEGGLIKKFKLS